MKTNVSITPAAELDLLETMGWYESIRPGLSKDFLLAFDAAVNQIARHPKSHALLERGLRRALLHRFSHGVFYLSQPDMVWNIAVLHTSRDPLDWQSREH